MIHRLCAQIKQNKPIYTCFAILDLSKVHMYRFHYNVMLAKYGLDCKLSFTDTDSLCYHIKTEDLYRDMQTFSDELVTSSYPTDSGRDALDTLYSLRNAKDLGKFKDECNGTAPLEFVGLRSKMYSLSVSRKQTKLTAKGAKKCFVKNQTNHMFLHTLQNQNMHHCTISVLPVSKSCHQHNEKFKNLLVIVR